MANPTPFVPGYSYSGYQASSPTRPLPAAQVDNDFANLQRTTNEIISGLANVRRSDGKLANGSVGPDQLSAALSIGFTFEGVWQLDTSYSAGDGVVTDNIFYSARESHVATADNAPDVDPETWAELFSLDDIVVAGALAMPRDGLVGDGMTTEFELSFSPLSGNNLFVQVGGIIQSPTEYSVNGDTLTFVTAPPVGYAIDVRGFATTASVITVSDGAITEPKFAADVAAKFNSALQPDDVGTAALEDVGYFATAAQGAKADTLPSISADSMIVDNTAGDARESKGFAQVRNLLGAFDTEADFLAANISANINSVFVYGHSEVGDGGQHEKMRISTPSSVKAWHKQSADGAWWQIVPGDVIRLEMFGAFPHIVCEPETKAWYDACATKPSYLHLMHTDRFIRRLKWRGVWAKLTGLWCFAGHTQADSGINIKNPGTYNATYGGTLTFAPGGGITGSTNGYIALTGWNNLITQNDGMIALYSAPNTQTPATGYVVSSLTLGSGGGVGIIPRDASNLLTRFMSTTSQFAANPYRGGVIVVSRDASDHYDVYTEGEVFQSPAQASSAVTTDTASLLRGNTSYVNDTVKFFATANDGLTEFEADAFSYFLRMYVDGLSSVIGKGPVAADLGFVAKTSDTDMATALSVAASFAVLSGKVLEVGFGTHQSSARLPVDGGNTVRGVHRQGSCIRLSSNAPQDEPVVAPSHRNGGATDIKVENMTLDGAYSIRGWTGFGPNRPGASGVNTTGSSRFTTDSLDIIDVGLHGIDMANTGEWNGTQYQYVVTPLPTKRRAGIPSVDCKFFNTQVEHQGDDGVTMHYSHDFEVDGVIALYAKDSGITTMGVEADDGSYNGTIRNVYARGNAFGAGSKSHADNPAPSNITFENITLECGYGRVLWISGDTSGNPDFGTNIHAKGITYLRPFEVASSEAIGVHITANARNVSVKDIKMKAKASDTSFLYRAIYVSGGASEVLIDGFSIENWAVLDDGVHGQGDTIRTVAGCSDVTIRNGKATGCGKYGLWDSGATRADYDNITVQGTGVASSIGFWISASVATNKTTNRALKVSSGFITEQTIVA